MVAQWPSRARGRREGLKLQGNDGEFVHKPHEAGRVTLKEFFFFFFHTLTTTHESSVSVRESHPDRQNLCIHKEMMDLMTPEELLVSVAQAGKNMFFPVTAAPAFIDVASFCFEIWFQSAVVFFCLFFSINDNIGTALIFYVLALLATCLGGRHQTSVSGRTGEVEVDVLTSASGSVSAPAEELTAELNGSSK